jgi:hypothetical protein
MTLTSISGMAYQLACEWQTLIAGLLALAGAWWTVSAIRDQVAQTQEAEREHRLREERAARAMLPLALSALVEYALDCIRLIEHYIPTGGTAVRSVSDGGLVAPRLPDEALEPLQAVVRHSDDEIAKQVATIFGKLQIQRARLLGLIGRSLRDASCPMSVPEGFDAVFDAADLHAYTVRLFEYARDVGALREKAGTDQIKGALRNAGLWDPENRKLFEEMDRRSRRA